MEPVKDFLPGENLSAEHIRSLIAAVRELQGLIITSVGSGLQLEGNTLHALSDAALPAGHKGDKLVLTADGADWVIFEAPDVSQGLGYVEMFDPVTELPIWLEIATVCTVPA